MPALLATFLELVQVPEALEVWRLSLVVDWVIVGVISVFTRYIQRREFVQERRENKLY